MASKCKDQPRKGASNSFKTNKRRPKKIWVPNEKIILIADVLDNNKQTPIMVPRQWLLTADDSIKVYVQKGKIIRMDKIGIHPYLQEMARTMLNDSSSPKHFLAKVVSIICYLQNKIYIRPIIKKTPYELWKG